MRPRLLRRVAPLVATLSACDPLPPGVATEADWQAWVGEDDRAASYAAFEHQLEKAGVADVVPAWHLWRQGTDWQATGHPPFAVPPPTQQAAMAPTLRLLRDEIVPAVGPVEVVSGFRTAAFNADAGGAKGSRHLHFEAVDVVPLDWQPRALLHHRLEGVWDSEVGPDHKLGLGLYSGTRFHVDTWRHRRW